MQREIFRMRSEIFITIDKSSRECMAKTARVSYTTTDRIIKRTISCTVEFICYTIIRIFRTEPIRIPELKRRHISVA
ncbi:hypothetical protein SDC9_161785 [bioreactor metagenome]|uniref:Uncharacterized protein n=1 Tax=bioreactor metagenome TaxID=1076179 RepID=A0A645FJ89_9ZZZZ